MCVHVDNDPVQRRDPTGLGGVTQTIGWIYNKASKISSPRSGNTCIDIISALLLSES